MQKLDKKQKSCVKRIHLVADNDLYDRNTFYKVKNYFYSSSINDGQLINYLKKIVLKFLSNTFQEIDCQDGLCWDS